MTWILSLILMMSAAQEADLAARFDGAWSRGPGHVMTEADWEAFNPCGCPLIIYAIDDRHIVLDWGLLDRRFEVSRDGEDYLWTPVDGGEARRVRLTPEGGLRIAPRSGSAPDWSLAQGRRRCPVGPDHEARRSAVAAQPASNIRSRCRN